MPPVRSPLSDSSGNPAADRRFEMAQTFIEHGDFAAAADLMRQALDLCPDWPEGQFALAEAVMKAGRNDDAIAAFRAYLALDPADSMGAWPKLTQLGAAPDTTELPPAYVERLFDQYAPRFDASLVERLHYSAPRAIRRTLEQRFPKRRYAACLDLGCGTGLMGAEIRDLVEHLSGVDLSQGMIGQARRKNIYDDLARTDAVQALRGAATYDLILAADVLVYLGDLRPIIAAAYDALVPDGVFMFTVQMIKGEGFRLGTDQRFSHSEKYIMDAMAMFQAVHVTPGTFRRERNEPVPGLLVLAIKAD